MVLPQQSGTHARHRRSWTGALRAAVVIVAGLMGADAAVASAPLTIAVRGATDPSTGATTMVQPDLGSHLVDFGHVANGGVHPRTGARIDGEDMSWYVATVELTVVRNADNTLGIQSVRAPAPVNGRPGFVGMSPMEPDIGAFPSQRLATPSTGAFRSSQGSPVMAPIPRRAQEQSPGDRLGGIHIPSTSQALADATTHVDVYVRLHGHEEGAATVWFSSPQTGGMGNAVELMFVETLVAHSVAIGQPFMCQVSFKVPASEWGHQNANVLFSARPSGT